MVVIPAFPIRISCVPGPVMAMGTVTFHSCVSKLHFCIPSSAVCHGDPLSLTSSTQSRGVLGVRLPTNSVRVRCSATNESIPVSAAESDAVWELKKKAVDVSSDLKGTSIFLVGQSKYAKFGFSFSSLMAYLSDMNCIISTRLSKGMNNSIKSSTGMLLADVLRYYYFDSDGLIAEAAGDESAAKSFRESDAEAFRESETEVLKQLSSMGKLVVCAGNGAVQNYTNLALLRYGISIWIDVPLEIIANGIAENQNQSYLSELSTSGSYSEVLSQLQALYEEMKSGYATADATISLQKVASQLGYGEYEAVTAEDMAMEVLKEIGKLTRVKKMMEDAARPF